MHTHRSLSVLAALALMALGVGTATAQSTIPLEVSLSGGVNFLNENDTAFPETFVGIPITGAVAYRFTDSWAAEAEFSYALAIEKDVDLIGGTVKRKSPDFMTYMANARATWPLKDQPWMPYATAGVGGITFLSDEDEKRLPALSESQTAFALDFGVGTGYRLTPNWVLRADFVAFVAFPSDDAEGLSTDGEADPIWMERGTVGVTYRF